MQTLSYGYLLPQTPDKGPEVFPALENNIRRMNDHTHDGINSPKVGLTSLTATILPIAPADWQDVGGGNYRVQMNCPTGIVLSAYSVSIKDSLGAPVHLTIQAITESQFYVFTNSPDQPYTVIFGI